jgi:hypothetical protein
MYYTPSLLLPPLAPSSTLLPSLAPSSSLLPSLSTSPSIRRHYRPSMQATIVCQSDQLYHPISQQSKQRKKKLTAPSSMQTARRASIILPTSNTMRVTVYPKWGELAWTIASQNFPMKSRSLAFVLEKISSTKIEGK